MGSQSHLPIDVDVAIIPPVANRPPAEAANFFHCSVAGDEIQLLVGYIDPELVLAQAGEATKGGRTFHPELSHRFLVTTRGFMLLREQLDAVAESVRAASEEVVDGQS